MIPNPWSLQVELTQGCNRRCEYCGIHSLKDEASSYKFMEVKLAEQIAKEMNEWIPKGRRIEFALQGEPTINPCTTEIIRKFRENYPKCQMMLNTNGYRISKEKIINYFNNGLNFLLLDIYDRITLDFCEKLESSDFPIQIESFHSGFNVYQYHNSKIQRVVFMDNYRKDAWEKTVVRKINNQAGYMPIEVQKKFGVYVEKPLQKNCSNVHRELVIKYDGTVTGCCMDWLRKLIMGKFPEQSLQEIWVSDRFQALRQLLYNKCRKIEPCNRCNYSGFKLGLIKDPGIQKTNKELIGEIVNEIHPSNTRKA